MDQTVRRIVFEAIKDFRENIYDEGISWANFLQKKGYDSTEKTYDVIVNIFVYMRSREKES